VDPGLLDVFDVVADVDGVRGSLDLPFPAPAPVVFDPAKHEAYVFFVCIVDFGVLVVAIAVLAESGALRCQAGTNIGKGSTMDSKAAGMNDKGCVLP